MGRHLYTQDQESLLSMIRDFAQNVVMPRAAEIDETGEFPWDIIEQGLEMGLHALDVPEAYGGAGIDMKTAAMVYEELAKADAGVACTFSVTRTGIAPILMFGTEEQKQRVADLVIRNGGLAAFCLTEPGSGSDSAAARTTAVRQGDKYILNGTKCFITNGGYANTYYIVASTDRSKGNKGLSGFLVEKGTPGLSIGKEEKKCGFRASNTVEVILEDVEIPASNLIGQEGDGFKQAMATLNHGRPNIGAVALGVGQRALDEAIKYTKERIQFGKPLCKNQGIQFMLADMEIKLEASRCLVYHVADLIDHEVYSAATGAIAKCFATDSAMQVALDAVQLFGGYGYMKEYPVEKLMRDAKIFQIVEGANQVQRMVIAGELLK